MESILLLLYNFGQRERSSNDRINAAIYGRISFVSQ